MREMECGDLDGYVVALGLKEAAAADGGSKEGGCGRMAIERSRVRMMRPLRGQQMESHNGQRVRVKVVVVRSFYFCCECSRLGA
jgi:hypothetical protein